MLCAMRASTYGESEPYKKTNTVYQVSAGIAVEDWTVYCQGSILATSVGVDISGCDLMAALS